MNNYKLAGLLIAAFLVGDFEASRRIRFTSKKQHEKYLKILGISDMKVDALFEMVERMRDGENPHKVCDDYNELGKFIGIVQDTI